MGWQQRHPSGMNTELSLDPWIYPSKLWNSEYTQYIVYLYIHSTQYIVQYSVESLGCNPCLAMRAATFLRKFYDSFSIHGARGRQEEGLNTVVGRKKCLILFETDRSRSTLSQQQRLFFAPHNVIFLNNFCICQHFWFISKNMERKKISKYLYLLPILLMYSVAFKKTQCSLQTLCQ